ncbi:hypothetical protein LZ009_02160 [Ramlibacter sp. XY19]|uniref:YchJ family protein n=1 Tax=Ramlibacter paludis TaxID=2908000 RepID=UPI0023DB8DF1|nr:YchJ family metal-binding protein [Ramlibacter paludis]MCG2591586.1 hypothetical protein [Ramlibacter paludis]
MRAQAAAACPCGRPELARCCGPYLADFDGCPAPDAEALMRSRYSAFVLEDAGYLLATWHASTRPRELTFEAGLKWLGLEVRDARQQDADHAEVEFVARSRLAGRGQRLHERSRFVREGGRWYYLDGNLK